MVWVIALAIIGATAGCQKAVEPSAVTTPVNVTVKVTDKGGARIKGAEVSFANVTKGAVPLQSAGLTDKNGLAVIRGQEVPINGAFYAFRAIPPQDSVYAGVAPLQYDKVPIPCRDTIVSFAFQRNTTIPCSSTHDESLDFLLCTDKDTALTLCSPLFIQSCTADESFTVNLASLSIPGMRVEVLDEKDKPLGSSFIVSPNQGFSLCGTFAPTSVLAKRTGSVTVTGSLGTTVVLHITAEAKLCKCDCPQDTTITYPSKDADTMCIGNSKNISIPLNAITNTGKEGCSLHLVRIRSFSNSGISMQSFNGSSDVAETILDAGTSLQPLVIRFAPLVSGPVRDTAIYQILRQDGSGGEENCARLTIAFNGLGSAGACKIDTTGSSIFNSGKMDTLTQCPDQKDPGRAKTLCILNQSPCPLPKITATIEGANAALFSVDPAQIPLIQPNKGDCFTVNFEPKFKDVWPNGRDKAPTTIFTAKLIINGCKPDTFNIVGKADTTCDPVLYICDPEYGAANGVYRNGFSITDKNTLTQVAQKPISEMDIYVESITVSGGIPVQATLKSGGTLQDGVVTFKVVASNRDLPAGTSACRLGEEFQKNGDCDSGGFGNSVNVRQGDVVLFKYTNKGEEHCGVIFIAKLDTDNGKPTGLPVVCMWLCYPLQ